MFQWWCESQLGVLVVDVEYDDDEDNSEADESDIKDSVPKHQPNVSIQRSTSFLKPAPPSRRLSTSSLSQNKRDDIFDSVS